MSEFTTELDTTGLNCPMPILQAKKALKNLATGEVLRIISTDPGSVKDFEAFAKQTGNELLESTTEGESFVYRLKKR